MESRFVPTHIACPGCGNAHDFERLLKVVNAYQALRPLRITVCRGCGLCFINPQYPAAAYSDYYQHRYYRENRNVPIEQIHAATRNHREAFFRYFERFAQTLPSGGRYLDAGAGTGQWLNFLFDARPLATEGEVHVLEP
jgi:MinD superfamily P-loop ATPase